MNILTRSDLNTGTNFQNEIASKLQWEYNLHHPAALHRTMHQEAPHCPNTPGKGQHQTKQLGAPNLLLWGAMNHQAAGGNLERHRGWVLQEGKCHLAEKSGRALGSKVYNVASDSLSGAGFCLLAAVLDSRGRKHGKVSSQCNARSGFGMVGRSRHLRSCVTAK